MSKSSSHPQAESADTPQAVASGPLAEIASAGATQSGTENAAESPVEAKIDADYALVTLAQAGDERAYEMLVIKYQRRIERLVGRMVRDVDIVQDIAQETFIRAWRALRNFRGDAQFYTWLYRIAVNSAKKHLMDVKRDPIITEAALRGAEDDDETSFADHPLNNRSTDSDTPETAYAAKEIGEAVNAAMDALPEELRQAITLRELEGLSYEEISEMMNCPIGTVRSRIFRAREAISARIKPMLQKQTTKRW
jgi:RNA polymerase sigma-70 factor, ECF subfamily